MKARPDSTNPGTLRWRKHQRLADLGMLRFEILLHAADVELLAAKIDDRRPGARSRTISPKEWRRDVESVLQFILEREARSLIKPRK